MDKLINNVYTDPSNPGAYGGAEALYRAVKKQHPEITKGEVRRFLEANRTYTIFKPRQHKFGRLSTVPSGFLSGRQKYLYDYHH